MLVFYRNHLPEYSVDETDTLPYAYLCSCCHAYGSVHRLYDKIAAVVDKNRKDILLGLCRCFTPDWYSPDTYLFLC